MVLVRELIICSALLVSAALTSSQRLLGAPAVVSENDDGVQRALQFAMNEYNKASNDRYSSRVSEVITAQKQVSSRAGWNAIVERVDADSKQDLKI